MMRIACLLLLGLLAGASSDEADVYVGELLAVSRDSIELDRNDSLVMIGFIGDPSVLDELDELKVGEEVRAVFGSAQNPDGPGLINKLLSIRRCVRNDAQCAADGRVLDAKEAEAEKARERSEAETERCNRKMEETLLADTRYAPTSAEISETQQRELIQQVNALTGQREECANNVINRHQTAVLGACQLHRCGDRIGGGCSHIAGHSLSDAVLAKALADCKDK